MSEYKKGLDGVVAARTEISHVDGQAGQLLYRGYEIGDVASTRTFEEVAHLLWFGEFPTGDQLIQFNGTMVDGRPLTEAARITIEALDKTVNPIDVLRTAISAQAAADSVLPPDIEQAIATAASIPTILASFYRRRQGLDLVKPLPDLGHAANYLYMLTGSRPSQVKADALNSYLILLADHGMNASTFASRVIASTASDLASCLLGGIGALKGALHGGAPTLVMEQLKEVRQDGNVEAWVADVLARHERIMGFGHAVYRTYDPRARILRAICQQFNPDFFAVASEVEEVVLRILGERYPQRPQATNVEFYSAGVLEFIGLPADLFTPTFAMARAVGWSAHVLEQVDQQSRGLSKIFRPQSEYIGPVRS